MFTVLGMNEIKRFSSDGFFGTKSENGKAGRRGVEYLTTRAEKRDHIGVVLDLNYDSSHLVRLHPRVLRRKNLFHAEMTAVALWPNTPLSIDILDIDN